MVNNEAIKSLYKALLNNGYTSDNIGDENTFATMMSDKNNRKKLYDFVTSNGSNIGDYETYERRLSSDLPSQNNRARAYKDSYDTANQENDTLDFLNTQQSQAYTAGYRAEAEKKLAAKEQAEQTADEAAVMRGYLESTGQLERLDEMKKQAEDEMAKHHKPMQWWEHFIPGYNMYRQSQAVENRLFNDEYRTAAATRDKVEEVQDLIDEASHADNGWLDKQLGGVVRGTVDAATKVSTWDLGATDLADAYTLNQIIEKQERGETLSASEESLLDVIGLASAIEYAYQDQVGMGYKVGQSLPESLGFMASLTLNPAAGAGKEIARRAAKSAMRKYGSKALAKAAGRAARVGGDIVEMGVATATTGAGRVAEDYFNRVNGQSTFDIDDKGIIRYGGQIEREEADKAIFKALGSMFIENYTEAMGEYFSPLGDMISGVVRGGVKKTKFSGLIDALDEIKSSQWSQAIKNFKDKAKLSGYVGELLEEEIGMVLNAATVGDMNFNNPDDPNSIFNPETQAMTALSVAYMQGSMLAVEVPGATGRLYTRNRLNAANRHAQQAWGDRWADMKEQLDASTEEHRLNLLVAADNTPDLTDEQRKTLKEYAVRLSAYQAYNRRSMLNREEMTEDARDVEAAQEAGMTMFQPEKRYLARRQTLESERALYLAMDELNDEQKQEVQSALNAIQQAFQDGASPNEIMDIVNGMSNENMARLTKNYILMNVREAAIRESAIDQVTENVAERRESIMAKADAEGNITTATFRDEPVFVVGTNGHSSIIVNENGERKMVSTALLYNVQTESVNEMMTNYEELLLSQTLSALDKDLNHHPKSVEPHQGMLLRNGEAAYVVQGIEPNGNVVVLPSTYDVASGQYVPNKNTNPLSISQAEAMALQDNFFAEEDAKANNMSAETAENASGPVVESEQNVSGEGVADDSATEAAAPTSAIEAELNEMRANNVDEEIIRATVEQRVREAEKNLQKAQNQMGKPLPRGVDVATEMKRRKDALALAEQELNEWQAVRAQNTPQAEPIVDENVGENQPTEENVIPTDESGNLLYHRVPTDVTLASINSEGLEEQEVDTFVANKRKKAEQLLNNVRQKSPKMGDNIKKYKEDKAAWEAQVADAQAQVDYWDNIAKELKELRKPIGEEVAEEILQLDEVMSGEELAAQMLAQGSLPLLQSSYKEHTGGGRGETKGMIGLFRTKEKGGLTVERAGELLALADEEEHNGRFFGGDSMVATNALLEVLSQVETRGGLTNYIREVREQQAKREQEAEYADYEQAIQAMYGVSVAEYEAMEEQIAQVYDGLPITDDQYTEFINTFVDEFNALDNGRQSERDAARSEGSSEVLRSEQLDNEGGVRGVEEQSEETDGGSSDQSEVAQGEEQQVSGFTLSGIDSGKGGNFYQDINGNIDLVDVIQEVMDALGIPNVPFRMTESMANHILKQHGEEIKVKSKEDVVAFVVDIMKNFDHVRQGNDAFSYVFSIENDRAIGKRAITIILPSENGEYLGVKSSGFERSDRLQRRPLLWEKGANETSATDTASANVTSETAQQGGEPNSSASNQSNGLTADKGSEVSENNKETGEKVDLLALAERVAKEEKRRKPLRERARKWSETLGVKVNLIERIEDVEDRAAAAAIRQGIKVAGWYNEKTGEVCFYMPNIDNMEEMDKTFIHEVVAHKGLRALLGNEAYNEVLDKVWDMMPESVQEEFLDYPGVNGNKRAAADEYIASLAEKQKLSPKEKTIWETIVNLFREALNKVLNGIMGKDALTEKDIETLIKLSYENLRSGASDVVGGEGTRFRTLEEINTQYNNELDAYANNALTGDIHLGEPSPILQASGLNASEMFMTKKTLAEHLAKHNLTVSDIKNLPNALQNPLMVYEWGDNAKSLVVITQIPRGEQRITIAVKLERGGKRLEINEIASVHGKDTSRFISDMINAKKGGLEKALKYAEKEKALDWLGLVPPKGTASLTPQERIAKVINDFVNPTISEEKSRFRVSDRFENGMMHDEMYDLLSELSEYSNGAYTLINELESYYGGELVSASNGARLAIRNDGLVPFAGEKYDGINEEYHHIEFEDSEGERFVKSVPFVTPEDLSERGIRFRRVYHGSGAEFDRFDHSFMGTGEGAQAFGWGTYVSDVEGIARGYADAATKPSVKRNGDSVNVPKNINTATPIEEVVSWYVWNYKNPENVIADDLKSAEQRDNKEAIRLYSNALEEYRNNEWEKAKRNLYQVDIPENDGTNFISWQTDNSQEVIDKLNNAYKNLLIERGVDEEDIVPDFAPFSKGLSGESIYRLLARELGSDREASNFLSRQGFVGIEYPTGTLSGGNTDGTKNYVIFNEHDLDIVEHTRFRAVTDKKLIDKLESEPKIKVYRAMQLVDGKLYPPMSAKVDGKMREPIELGKWEEAEERPDMADEKGYFKLNKGNGKSLKARYNPYIHTSTTPLNDQFSSAQDRPELVTVEVEVPESELTSGYKADKAKDAVGKLEWKAGVVQGKLSGTRTVILSRWDKPIRIVPDSEVADEIVKMFGDKQITMPSNVVTPSLRAELEKRGVPFVETDNQGREVGGTRSRAKKDAKELIVAHNLSESDLRKVLNMGSLIAPSIAITRYDMGHEGYGDITLLFDKETINPSDRRNKVYGGDAWTPRFPQIVPKISDKVRSNIKKKVYELIEDRKLRENYRLSAELHPDNVDRTITNRGIEGYYNEEWMKLAYLLDNGKKVKIPMKMKDYGDMSETIIAMAKEQGLKLIDVLNGSFDFYFNNPEFVAAVKKIRDDAFINSIPEERRDAVRKVVDGKKMEFNRFNNLIYQAREMERDLENGGLKQLIDKAALRETIEKKVKTNNADYNEWVDNLFNGIVEKYGIRNSKDEFTPSGNSLSWEQLHDAATPANILRHMLSENEQGGSGGFWDSDIMGASAESYNSIEEIREKGKKRLRKLDEGEYDEWSDSIANRMSEICNDFLSPSQRNEIDAAIDSKIEITNAVAKDKSAKGIYKYMKPLYPNFTMEHANRVEEIVKEIQEQAIGYFEAKPQRIVPLSEIRKAIVPKNTSEDVLKGLRDNGIEIATYKRGDEKARQRAIKRESQGIRFRVSGDPFYSNAERAVEGIKQEKATPQQWLAMIEKNGGLKAGEDKWLGLSDWLKASDKKSLTKQEVLDFINANKIQIEEVNYGGGEWEAKLDALNEEFRELIDEGEEATGSIYTSDWVDYAYEAMVDRYGDDFRDAFEVAGQGTAASLEATYDWNDNLSGAAQHYLGVENPINSTREGYTTEGLENKQEIALTVPTIESWNESDEIHFGDAGDGRAVAWVRFGETTDADGNRVLVIDEIQSKRHQEGRENGYGSDADIEVELGKWETSNQAGNKKLSYEVPVAEVKRKDTGEVVAHIVHDNSKSVYYVVTSTGYSPSYDSVEDALSIAKRTVNTNLNINKVPSAPFEKNWHELAMKRMLRYAAENGYDKVAWTKGAQQAERYDLAKQVSSIEYAKLSNGHYKVIAYGTNGYPIKDIPAVYNNEQEIAEMFGKEIAVKVMQGIERSERAIEDHTKAKQALREKMKGVDEDSAAYEAMLEEYALHDNIIDGAKRAQTIEGDDLSIGGEGMKGFYDEMLPRFMNKYGKKWGVKVGEVELPDVEESARKMWSVDVTNAMKESVMEGQPMFRVAPQWKDGEVIGVSDTLDGYVANEGLTGKYTSPTRLLDAFRNKYPQYFAELNSAGNIVVTKWSSIFSSQVASSQVASSQVASSQVASRNEGKKPLTKKQQRAVEYAEREANRRISSVEQMADRLHIKVRILTDTKGLKGKAKRAKGWYDVQSGEITILMPNHVSMDDVMRTILHEAVAHHGLRTLFGKHFNTFLDNVYSAVPESIRAEIVRMASVNGWDIREATEEYLASLAEDTNFENAINQGWFAKVKELFLKLLAKVGYRLRNGVLTDNDLRYILWRSYDNLKNPGERDIFDFAKDVVMQDKLGVRGYESSPTQSESAADSGRRFRVSKADAEDARREISKFIPRAKNARLFSKPIDLLNPYNGLSFADRLVIPYLMLKNIPIRAYYSHINDSVVMLLNNLDSKAQAKSSIIHEYTHLAVNKLLKDGGITESDLDDLLDFCKKSYPDIYKKATYHLYKDKDHAAECAAFLNQHFYGMLGDKLFEDATFAGKTKYDKLFSKILNELKNGEGTDENNPTSGGRGRQSVSRRGSGFNAEYGSGNGGEQGVQGTDSYSSEGATGRVDAATEGVRFRVSEEKVDGFASIYKEYLKEDYVLPSYAQEAVDSAIEKMADDMKARFGNDGRTFFANAGEVLTRKWIKEYEKEYSYYKGYYTYDELTTEGYSENDKPDEFMEEVLNLIPRLDLAEKSNIEKYIPAEVLEAVVVPSGNNVKFMEADTMYTLQQITGKSGVELLEEYAKENPDLLSEEGYEALGTRFRVNDADYAKAVEEGDAKKVTKLVKDAAKAAMPNTKVVDRWGKPKVVYHGTTSPERFNEFKGDAIFFTSSEADANLYSHERGSGWLSPKQSGKPLSFFLNLENPLEVDARGKMWDKIIVDWSSAPVSTDDIAAYARENGYDGAIISKVKDSTFTDMPASTVYIALNSNQIKDAGATHSYDQSGYGSWHIKEEIGATYDDNGNLIPLSERFNTSEGDIRFRVDNSGIYDDGGNEVALVEREVGAARDQYERRLKTATYQFQEAMQDSMLALKELQKAIAKATKSKILDFENAWMAENALSSKSLAEMNAYRELLFKPLLGEIANLEKEGMSYEEITDYLITKHGIERNREMAVRDALKEDKDTYKQNLERWNQEKQAVWADDTLTWEEQQVELDRIARSYGADLKSDYSGLSAMYGDDWSTSAYDAVKSVESAHNTKPLYDALGAATSATIDKPYESGLMSKEAYEGVKQMFQFYVPLRGWEEDTSEDVYEYLTTEAPAFNAPLKKMKGRKSKADDPIATLANVAESAILQGNRNVMKQKFLNMVMNHPSDAVSVSELWLEYDSVSDEWKAIYPEIPEKASAAEVERIVDEFNEKMENLSQAEPDKYIKASNATNIPYKTLPQNMSEHQVIVKRGGKEYILTINGNPRAAQALNGLTNPDNDANGAIGAILKSGEWLNRQLSAFYTTRNPNFMASNYLRDAIYSNTMAWVKESPAYAWNFNKNFAKVNPKKLHSLIRKYRKGTLDMRNPMEKAFKEFILNGGETGYTNLRDVEKQKKVVKRELKKAKKVSIAQGYDWLAERFDDLNRSIENCARFAAYFTSRQQGRSIERSVFDAKEISVNFNKKGAGAKFMGATGETKVGNVASFVSGLGRAGFVFWNAGVQGLYNFGKAAANNPIKFTTACATFYLLGALMPMLADADDDDDDELDNYENLPDYVRRTNICFRNGFGDWVTIPLPIELRALYGLGEMSTMVLSGKEKADALKIAEQLSQVMPIDMLEGEGGLKAFVPSAVKPVVEAYVWNKDWTGLPIYKDNPYNKQMPEWTKTYKNADPTLIKLSELTNEFSGGNKYKKGWADWNPAKVEHLLEGYFGGVATTINQMSKTVQTLTGDMEFDWRNIPIGSRVIKSGNPRVREQRINNEYYDNLDKMEELRQQVRGFEKEVETSKDSFEIAKYQKMLNDLKNSEEYNSFEVFREMNRKLDKLNKEYKESGDAQIEQQMFDLKAAMNEVVK